MFGAQICPHLEAESMKGWAAAGMFPPSFDVMVGQRSAGPSFTRIASGRILRKVTAERLVMQDLNEV